MALLKGLPIGNNFSSVGAFMDPSQLGGGQLCLKPDTKSVHRWNMIWLTISIFIALSYLSTTADYWLPGSIAEVISLEIQGYFGWVRNVLTQEILWSQQEVTKLDVSMACQHLKSPQPLYGTSINPTTSMQITWLLSWNHIPLILC